MFDVAGHLDELRSWPTDRLVAHHERLIAQQRRLHLEDLDVSLVLDERGCIDTTVGADGESAQTARRNLETARRLEALPAVAAAAHDGRLSDEQLSSVTRLADEGSDAEWAVRAPNIDPLELARRARNAAKPTVGDARARFAARELRMWWSADQAMLQVRGQLPDVMGATFEQVITKLAEQVHTPDQPWTGFDQRAADALVGLCDPPASADEHMPTLAPLGVAQLQVPLSGPAEIAGVPIADALVEQLRANVSIEPVLVDTDGAVITVGTRSPGLSPKLRRAVLLRDSRCRFPGCGRRRGLEVHHLLPRSRGAATASPTSRWSAPRITDSSSPTACWRWSATPTGPTDSVSSPRVEHHRCGCDRIVGVMRIGATHATAHPTRREVDDEECDGDPGHLGLVCDAARNQRERDACGHEHSGAGNEDHEHGGERGDHADPRARERRGHRAHPDTREQTEHDQRCAARVREGEIEHGGFGVGVEDGVRWAVGS
jgi:hypothetical protein